MKKNFWTTKQRKDASHLAIEQKMIPRLKCVGYLLCLFSLAAFTYAFLAPKEFIHQQHPFTAMEEGSFDPFFDSDPREILNFYFVSAVFAVNGLTIVFTAKKKGTK